MFRLQDRRPPRSRATRFASFLALACLGGGTGPLVADTVWLTNGRSLEGRAVVRDDGDVELHSTMGVVRFPAHKVDRVERSESIEDRVAVRLDSLVSVSPDDLYELGMEARLAGAYTLSERLLEEGLRLDPDHEATRRALGFVRTPDGWMLEHLVARRAPAPRADGNAAEAAERIALLRALRAQSEAARSAELQRQQLLALEAQRLAAAERAESDRDATLATDDFVVRTVIPIWSVPYGLHPTSAQPPPAPRATPTETRRTPRRAAPAQQTQRRNTIVRSSGPN